MLKYTITFICLQKEAKQLKIWFAFFISNKLLCQSIFRIVCVFQKLMRISYYLIMLCVFCFFNHSGWELMLMSIHSNSFVCLSSVIQFLSDAAHLIQPTQLICFSGNDISEHFFCLKKELLFQILYIYVTLPLYPLILTGQDVGQVFIDQTMVKYLLLSTCLI